MGLEIVQNILGRNIYSFEFKSEVSWKVISSLMEGVAKGGFLI